MLIGRPLALAILTLSSQGLIFGCSFDKPRSFKSQSSKRAIVHDDYRITTFGSSNLTPKEAIKKYIPKEALAKGVDYEALVTAADKAMEEMDYEGGAVLANEAVKKDPNKARAYYLRGRGIYNGIHGSSDKALKDFLKAAQLGDKDGRSNEYAARIYSDQNLPRKAIKSLTKAIEIDPQQRDYYKYRAALYAELKEFDNARKNYNLHVRVAPTKLSGYIERARFHYSMKDYASAIKDYSTVIALTDTKNQSVSKRTFALRLRAGVYSEIGKHHKAISDYNLLQKMHPTTDEFYKLRGEEYAAVKEYKKALDDLTQSIEIAPEFASGTSYMARSKVYRHMGKTELAKADLQKAKEIEAMPAEKNLFKLKH